MRRVVLGIMGLVMLQLQEVTWKFSNIYMRRVALGIKRLVCMQLQEVTWKFSNTQ